MKKTEVILIGGGGHARVVADCLLSAGVVVKGFFDKSNNGSVLNLPFLGNYNFGTYTDLPVIIAIGDNATRKRLAEEDVKHNFFTAVHPSALCSAFSQIGSGSMVLHGAIVQAGAQIGKHVILNTGSQVDHDCELGDYTHIAPGAVLCGAVKVGSGTLIGANAVVIPGVKIGRSVIVGAGAVVVSDVPEFAIVVGNPAKAIR